MAPVIEETHSKPTNRESSGRKRLKGDNKTPQGMYFVTQKHRGRFDGAYGAYYGGHWINSTTGYLRARWW